MTPTLSALPAGEYDGIVLTVDVEHRVIAGELVSASVGNGTEAAPQFTCHVVFYAPLVDAASAPVLAPLGTPTTGTLTATGPDRFRLQLDDQPGGCPMIDPLAGTLIAGAEFAREPQSSAPARAFRVIAVEKGRFYASPDGAARKAYVVRGDVVAVVEERDGWVRGRFGRTEGWLRPADLVPLPAAPP